MCEHSDISRASRVRECTRAMASTCSSTRFMKERAKDMVTNGDADKYLIIEDISFELNKKQCNKKN